MGTDTSRELATESQERSPGKPVGSHNKHSHSLKGPDAPLLTVEAYVWYCKALRDILETLETHTAFREHKRNNVKHVIAMLKCILTDPGRFAMLGAATSMEISYSGKKGKDVVYTFAP